MHVLWFCLKINFLNGPEFCVDATIHPSNNIWKLLSETTGFKKHFVGHSYCVPISLTRDLHKDAAAPNSALFKFLVLSNVFQRKIHY